MGVDNEYGIRVVTSGTTLVLPETAFIVGRCADNLHHAEAEQKADNKIREIDIWAVYLLFVFHNYTNRDLYQL